MLPCRWKRPFSIRRRSYRTRLALYASIDAISRRGEDSGRDFAWRNIIYAKRQVEDRPEWWILGRIISRWKISRFWVENFYEILREREGGRRDERCWKGNCLKVWIKVFGLRALRRFRRSKIRDWKIQLSFFRASKTKFFSRGGRKERRGKRRAARHFYHECRMLIED